MLRDSRGFACKSSALTAARGGLLATGGGLVFQGNSGSEFAAYNSATGDRLWRFAAQTSVVAPPITYTVNGEQYVAVLAGWGGAFALSADGALIDNMHPVRNISRLLVFKLGGTAALPAHRPGRLSEARSWPKEIVAPSSSW